MAFGHRALSEGARRLRTPLDDVTARPVLLPSSMQPALRWDGKMPPHTATACLRKPATGSFIADTWAKQIVPPLFGWVS